MAEVRTTLYMMGKGKIVGLDEIPIEGSVFGRTGCRIVDGSF